MYRIFSILNKNKLIICLSIFVIIIILIVMKSLNEISANQNENKTETQNIVDTNISYAIISQTNIEQEEATELSKIIEEFVNYCNNNQIEQAYNMISEQCKTLLFPTVEEFRERYYNNIFNDKKNYEIQLWDNRENYYIYRIDYVEDILSTGNANAKKIVDYYTVDATTNTLNINGFIKNIAINKVSEKNNVEITVLSKDIFIDYEVLNIKVKNDTANSILLDSGESTDSMYIENEKGLKFISYSHELIYENLRIKSEKELSIKFNKKYGLNDYSEKLVLSDIILNNEEYEQSQNKQEFNNRMSMEINL